MIPFKKLVDDESKVYKKKGNKYNKTCFYSDTIYTFDIETSNLFNIDGVWSLFDYSKNKDFYTHIDKIGVPYVWQFSINDKVYYGREFMDFEKVLISISNPELRKIIYVHNLSWETQFLFNIISDKYSIENMICRDIRKPISFFISELNIEFRCSYMLTNMSLKNASKEFTSIEKLDTLEYDSKIRTPLSTLTSEELEYMKYDCLCVYEIIKHFVGIYEHICLIPLTSTGEVRREFRKQVDFFYNRKMQKLVPDMKTYMILWACFSGGYTHSNIINTNQIIKNVSSKDIASSYPYSMLCKLPSTEFIRCLKAEFNTNKNYGYIAYIKFYNVDSRYYTHYMQVSKCINAKKLVADNGRVVSCDYVEMWLTSIDFDVITKNYDIGYYEVEACYKSYLNYLDERIIKFILKLYQNKTTLKGIKGKESIYKRDKSMLNSLYGMSVTNPLKQSAKYENGNWVRAEMSEEFINEKLDEMRKSSSTLMFYGMGVWITALSRKHLMDCVLFSHKFDKHVIYCDTDSIKYYGNFDYVFNWYNKKVYSSYKELCKQFNDLSIEDFQPIDSKGVKHPIGMYEEDSFYSEFCTLGAKKYVGRESDGMLHLTISGVAKSGVIALNNNIRNFKKGLVFDYNTSGKLTHFYNDNQPETDIVDYEGNMYHFNLSHGITLAPTTYTLGTTELYDILIEQFMIDESERRYNE